MRHAVREYLMGVLLVEDDEAHKNSALTPEQREAKEVGAPSGRFHTDPRRRARRRQMILERRSGH